MGWLQWVGLVCVVSGIGWLAQITFLKPAKVARHKTDESDAEGADTSGGFGRRQIMDMMPAIGLLLLGVGLMIPWGGIFGGPEGCECPGP